MKNKLPLETLVEKGLIWTPQEFSSKPVLKQGQETDYEKFVPFIEVPFVEGMKREPEIAPPSGLRRGAIHEWFQEEEIGGLHHNSYVNGPHIIFAVLVGNAVQYSRPSNKNLNYFSTSSGDSLTSPYLFWVGREVWPTPFILQQTIPADLFPRHTIFIDCRTPQECVWTLETILQTCPAAVIAATCSRLSFTTSQRLALLAQRQQGIIFLARPLREKSLPSAAASRWCTHPTVSSTGNPRWQLRLLKIKGSRPRCSEWIIEYTDEKKIRLCISSTMVNRDRTQNPWRHAS